MLSRHPSRPEHWPLTPQHTPSPHGGPDYLRRYLLWRLLRPQATGTYGSQHDCGAQGRPKAPDSRSSPPSGPVRRRTQGRVVFDCLGDISASGTRGHAAVRRRAGYPESQGTGHHSQAAHTFCYPWILPYSPSGPGPAPACLGPVLVWLGWLKRSNWSQQPGSAQESDAPQYTAGASDVRATSPASAPHYIMLHHVPT